MYWNRHYLQCFWNQNPFRTRWKKTALPLGICFFFQCNPALENCLSTAKKLFRMNISWTIVICHNISHFGIAKSFMYLHSNDSKESFPLTKQLFWILCEASIQNQTIKYTFWTFPWSGTINSSDFIKNLLRKINFFATCNSQHLFLVSVSFIFQRKIFAIFFPHNFCQ